MQGLLLQVVARRGMLRLDGSMGERLGINGSSVWHLNEVIEGYFLIGASSSHATQGFSVDFISNSERDSSLFRIFANWF
jgi:hypothetical protein